MPGVLAHLHPQPTGAQRVVGDAHSSVELGTGREQHRTRGAHGYQPAAPCSAALMGTQGHRMGHTTPL